MSADPQATDPQATEPAKPSPSRKPRRFASPRGGDVDPNGTRVVQYYNPSPGVVAKRQRSSEWRRGCSPSVAWPRSD
jgi:hypothetical protein